MKIEFYTPEWEMIPTTLRLNITELKNHPPLKATYEQYPDEFAYKLTVYHALLEQPDTFKICNDIADKFISILQSQSYDHGASWRLTDKIILSDSDEYSTKFKLSFRVRDAG